MSMLIPCSHRMDYRSLMIDQADRSDKTHLTNKPMKSSLDSWPCHCYVHFPDKFLLWNQRSDCSMVMMTTLSRGERNHFCTSDEDFHQVSLVFLPEQEFANVSLLWYCSYRAKVSRMIGSFLIRSAHFFPDAVSRKPLANGLLLIFNLVISKRRVNDFLGDTK